MLESGRDQSLLGVRQLKSSRRLPTARGRGRDFANDLDGAGAIEPELGCDVEQEIEPGRRIVETDRRIEAALAGRGSGLRSKAGASDQPALLVRRKPWLRRWLSKFEIRIEKAIRRHSSRESAAAFGEWRLGDVGDLQIAAALAVGALQHVDEAAVDRVQAPRRDVDAAIPGELQRHRFPAHYVPLVVGRARELGDRELSLGVDHLCLGTSAAERAAAPQQGLQAVVVISSRSTCSAARSSLGSWSIAGTPLFYVGEAPPPPSTGAFDKSQPRIELVRILARQVLAQVLKVWDSTSRHRCAQR